MTSKEIARQIVQIAFEVTGAELNETDTLKECGLDSLSLVAVIAEMEERFAVVFTETQLDPADLQTLAGLVRIAEQHV